MDAESELEIDMKLREELAAAAESDSEPEEQGSGSQKGDIERKNTKAEIIKKIYKCFDDRGLICPHPPSKLKRMSKNELLGYLGETISEAMTEKINQKLGCENIPEHASDSDRQRLMAASFLTMAHNVLTKGAERCVESYSEYTIEGLSDTFEEPRNKQILEETLMEIAAEYDIIEYIDSPWSKLGLLWSTGVISTLRKKN